MQLIVTQLALQCTVCCLVINKALSVDVVLGWNNFITYHQVVDYHWPRSIIILCINQLTWDNATSNIGKSVRFRWNSGIQSLTRTSGFMSFDCFRSNNPFTEQCGYLAACNNSLTKAVEFMFPNHKGNSKDFSSNLLWN